MNDRAPSTPGRPAARHPSVPQAGLGGAVRPRGTAGVRVVLLTLGLASQVACVKGGMDQLASPASLEDMHTILRDLNLSQQLGALVQEVLDVGSRNVDDRTWDALVQETATALVDQATPLLRGPGGRLDAAARSHAIAEVRATFRQLATERSPHDRLDVATRLTDAIVGQVGADVTAGQRTALLAALSDVRSAGLDGAVAGPAPFARLVGRNLALGILDGVATFDPEPIHRFMAEERTAFAVGAQESLLWWKFSFWIAAAAAAVGLIGVSLQLWRDVHMRRRNTKTLRLLAGALKAREADPSIREMLTTIADPKDPDAARHLSEFYRQHPDLRLNLRADPPSHPVAPQEQP